MRYDLEKGSHTGHCCFTWSVMGIGTDGDGRDVSEVVAECFNKEEAELIVSALNRQAG
jgi:peptidyl-tRNA hydrolase